VRPRTLAALVALGVAGAGLAWLLRALRPPELFTLHLPGWPFNARLLQLTHDQLVILSLEKGWIVAHPALLRHPLVIAAVAATVWLVPQFRRCRTTRFLVCAMAAPLLLCFNPLTATLLGAAISPWAVYRLLWPLPVSLTLAWALRLAAGRWWARRGWSRRWVPGAAATAVVAIAGLLLAPRMARAFRAVSARNHVHIGAGEKELLCALAANPRWGGGVLAPPPVNIHIWAWSSRYQPLPSLDAYRVPHPELTAATQRLLGARRIGEEEASLLNGLGVALVAARSGSRMDRLLAALPPAFVPVFQGSELTLYAWRAERWPQARADVSRR